MKRVDIVYFSLHVTHPRLLSPQRSKKLSTSISFINYILTNKPYSLLEVISSYFATAKQLIITTPNTPPTNNPNTNSNTIGPLFFLISFVEQKL